MIFPLECIALDCEPWTNQTLLLLKGGPQAPSILRRFISASLCLYYFSRFTNWMPGTGCDLHPAFNSENDKVISVISEGS